MSGDAWERRALEVLTAEYEAAQGDGAATHPRPATQRHYARCEEHMAGLDAVEPPACSSGCAYCCHLRVSVRAHEALYLAAALMALPEERQRGLRARLIRNAERVRSMTASQHTQTPLRCALLAADNTCSMYAQRPLACRRYHSMSVAACRESFERPQDLSSRIVISNRRVVASVAQELAYRKVLEEARRDTSANELNTALVEALDDPQGCLDRWLRGERAFVQALPGEAPEHCAAP
jgi:Fe-S-cluster containining protein